MRYFYLLCMSVMCCISVPLTFIQYFYTRERITEERRNQYGIVGDVKTEKVKEATFMEQFRACIKDKYWIMLTIMIQLYQITNGMKTVSQVYYSGWVVAGNSYGEYAAIRAKFTMIAMAPVGPALFVLLPMYKKFGREKVIIVGSILAMIGGLTAYLGAGNTGMVYGGTMIAQGILFFVLFVFFFKIEREMPKVQKALEDKKKAECEAQGIVYIPQSELERQERAKQEEEAEANRIAELKERCAKKGLDFDTESQKVLDKRAKKAARKAKAKK